MNELSNEQWKGVQHSEKVDLLHMLVKYFCFAIYYTKQYTIQNNILYKTINYQNYFLSN